MTPKQDILMIKRTIDRIFRRRLLQGVKGKNVSCFTNKREKRDSVIIKNV